MTSQEQDIGLMENNQDATLHIGENQAIHCEGCWTMSKLADLEQTLNTFSWPSKTDLVWDGSHITAIDTGGALVLHRSLTSLQHQGHHITWLGLRAEFAELLKLVASETPRPKGGASLKPKKTVAFVCPGLPFIPMQRKGLSWQV